MAFFTLYLRLFFLLTPFFVLSMFLAWTDDLQAAERRRLAVRVTAAVLLGALALLFFGNEIFRVLGITLDAFRVGAGVLLFLSAVGLVRGDSAKQAHQLDGDIAVVPLAIPVTLGPATIGALMVMSADRARASATGATDWSALCLEVVSLVAAILTVGTMLYLSSHVERLVGRRGLTILSKLTGLVLAAMSAQMVFTGARELLAFAPA